MDSSEDYESPRACIQAAEALVAVGRHSDADAVLCAGLAQFGSRPTHALHVAYARSASRRDDWGEALRRWTLFQEHFPQVRVGFVERARAHLKLGDLVEAEELSVAAMEKFPDDQPSLLIAAQVATKRQTWSQAVRRWQLLRDLNPNDKNTARQLATARWALQFEMQSGADPGSCFSEDDEIEKASIQTVSDPEARNLMLRFESLGERCEFGLVQRRFEAEPLSLLRWAATKPAKLCELLEAGFEDLGDESHTKLYRSHAHAQYDLIDTKYGLLFHTWMVDAGGNEAAFLSKHAARLRWLRGKFISDLQEAHKILVLKPLEPLPDTALRRILGALRTYGNNTLLYVEIAAHQPCDDFVVQEGGHLLRGFVSRQSKLPGLDWDIPFEEWIGLCKKATDAVPSNPC